MTSSNGNIFRVTGHLCGEFTGHRWIPRTKGSDASFDVFFDLNKRLSKQSWCWWFQTPSRPLWRHCNASASEAPCKVWVNKSHEHIRNYNITIQINTGSIFGGIYCNGFRPTYFGLTSGIVAIPRVVQLQGLICNCRCDIIIYHNTCD